MRNAARVEIEERILEWQAQLDYEKSRDCWSGKENAKIMLAAHYRVYFDLFREDFRELQSEALGEEIKPNGKDRPTPPNTVGPRSQSE